MNNNTIKYDSVTVVKSKLMYIHLSFSILGPVIIKTQVQLCCVRINLFVQYIFIESLSNILFDLVIIRLHYQLPSLGEVSLKGF